MSTRSSNIADFYQQLALLVRSNLPLPESLYQLGRSFPKPEFKFLLLKISDRVGKGEKLSDVIRNYPQFFDPIHVRLIAAGEQTGTLPETLLAVARFSRFCQLMTARMRDIIAYPMFSIHLSIITVMYISMKIVPKFKAMFEEMLSVQTLPPITRLIMGVGMFIHDNWLISIFLYVVLLGFSIWLFTPGLAPHRVLMSIINSMPGSLKIVHSLDSARFCTLGSTFIRQNMPLHDAMETSAQLVDQSSLRKALQRVAQRLRSGGNISDAFAAEKEIDPLIVQTFANAPEKELSVVLGQLGELFEHRVTLAVRSASFVWTAVSFLATALVVCAVAVGMFQPLVAVIRGLAE